jgi:zinc transporter 9
MGIFTYMFLRSNIFTLPPEATGYCMLFSAGTFLYVSTVHVLPEIQSHNENRQFNVKELVSFIVGSIVPLFLSIGHSH